MGGPISLGRPYPRKAGRLSQRYQAQSGFHRVQGERKAGRKPSVAKMENKYLNEVQS